VEAIRHFLAIAGPTSLVVIDDPETPGVDIAASDVQLPLQWIPATGRHRIDGILHAAVDLQHAAARCEPPRWLGLVDDVADLVNHAANAGVRRIDTRPAWQSVQRTARDLLSSATTRARTVAAVKPRRRMKLRRGEVQGVTRMLERIGGGRREDLIAELNAGRMLGAERRGKRQTWVAPISSLLEYQRRRDAAARADD
jgi:hypothetical protein